MPSPRCLREVATAPSEAKNTLSELVKAITAVLRGERNEKLTKALESVRTIFIRVSKMILGAEVATWSDTTSFGAQWSHSTMNSTS
jgi:hypothetical protein